MPGADHSAPVLRKANEMPATPGLSPTRRNARIAALSGALAAGGYAGASPGATQLVQDHSGAAENGHTQGDDDVSRRVREALVNTDDLRALDIELATDEGVVDLRGEVYSQRQARAAAEVARNQPGARGVRNRLRVRESGNGAPDAAAPPVSSPADPAPTSTSAPPPRP